MSEHDPLMAFVDGELSAEEQARFRVHLGDCESCRRELSELIQLRAIEDQTRGARVIPLRRRRAAKVIGVIAAVAAAGAMFAVLRPEPRPFAAGPSRSIEPWISYGPAGAHRVYDTMRSAGTLRGEEIPLSVLAALEANKDLHGLGAAWLLRGDPRRAAEVLARAGDDAAVLSDLAAAHLESGELDAALQAIDRALDRAPEHAAARFNRALIAEKMGLLRLARAEFDRASRSGVPGWAEEARVRRVAIERRDTDREALVFVQTMIDVVAGGRDFDAELVARSPAQAIEIYTLAVLAASSDAELSKLEVIARSLDAALPRAGAGVHLNAAKKSAPRRFVAAPWFKRLAVTLAGYSPRADELVFPAEPPMIDDPSKFIEEVLEKGAADQKLAALFYYRERAAHEVVWKENSAAIELPYFSCARGWAAFTYDWLGGTTSEQGLRALEETISACAAADLSRQVVRGEHQQANVLFFSRDLVRAREVALRARESARRLPDLRLEGQALEVLFNVARYRRERALMRALGEEWRLLDPRPERVLSVHEALANTAVFALDWPAAQRELASARASGAPLSIVGAFVLADLHRLFGRAEDLAALEAALDAKKEEHSDPPTQLLVRHILALARLRTAREAALEELAAIIREARALAGDATAKSAEAYSVSLLALEAGEDGRFDDVIHTIAAEQKLDPAPRCLVAMETHLERTAIAARDHEGRTFGRMLSELAVPRDLETSLASCTELTVLARPALHGKSGLFDRSIAYSFAVHAAPSRARTNREVLYVYGTTPPASAGLAPLSPLAAELTEGARILAGERATPRAVLAAIASVGWAELHTHGKLYGDSDSAALALSPDRDGDYRLFAEDVTRARLVEAPIVVLAACDAADIQREDLFEPFGLPVAFLRAGASAVLAADAPVADARAAEFFRDVRRRVEAGATVAIALRDARMAWPGADRSWIETVVVFEGGKSK